MEGKERFRTPHGNIAELYFREDASDRSVIESIFTNDEYGIPNDIDGWAVDIGAHVGAWSIAVALDNPRTTVLGIEALAENVLLAQRNVRLNGLEKRVKIIQRAAGASNYNQVIHYGRTDTPFDSYNRYIGNANGKGASQTVQGIRLTRLMRTTGPIQLMKIDCEGCEWQFLKSSKIKDVATIVGEYHNAADVDVVALLGDTHHVEFTAAPEPGLGSFKATRIV